MTRHETIGAIRLGMRLRAAIYGHDARPLGRAARGAWARLGWTWRWHPGLDGAAQAIGREVQGEPLPPCPETDTRLRGLLSDRMHALPRPAARRRREKMSPATRQSLLDSRCPLCASPLPCASCGIPRVKPDGRGGLAPI